MPLVDTLRAALRATFADRPLIGVGRDPKTAASDLGVLQELGAGPTMLVYQRPGAAATGLCHDPVEHALTDSPRPADFVLDTAALDEALGALSAETIDALDAFDPAHAAAVLGTGVLTFAHLGGRRRLGGRLSEHTKLEDKTHVDAIFDNSNVPRLPSRVVPSTLAALTQAATELDQGHGTVWQGDNTSAVEGGALATRWVHDRNTAEAAATFLGPRCRTTRVTPFAEGVPCSIHVWCLRRGVAVLRPVEMVVLRDPAAGRFHFCGLGTTWDAPPEDRSQMRALAKKVGQHMADVHQYRGAMSIDGVLTEDGFRPTELNPRFSAGLWKLSPVAPELELRLSDVLVREGALDDWEPAELEEELMSAMDEQPVAWLQQITPQGPTTDRRVELGWHAGRWKMGGTDAVLEWRSGRVGGAVVLDLHDPDDFRGHSGARLLVDAVQTANVAIPELTPLLGHRRAASEVR
jgi:hypothetical protein